MLRVGLDLVSVASVEEVLESDHREHYLRRVYTPSEVDDCREPSGRIQPERLAARFAAKEAAIKALPGAGAEVRLTSIEVRAEPGGGVHLELSGRAAELAREAGISELAVSITHESGFAAASVITA